MVNDWECVRTVDVGEGERLVTISWIDTGIKVTHANPFNPFSCFYRVIGTQVEVWENEKCCGNTSQ